MRFTGFLIRLSLTLVFVGTTALAPGCASTKNVMNKATFGLVGNKDDGAKEQKRAEKKQKEAEKRTAKKEKKAQKKTRKAEKRTAKAQSEDTKRGFWNKATFGLVGDESNDKAAKKEAKRQAKQDKKAQKQAAKKEKKAQEQARKNQKQIAKAEKSDDSSEQAEKPERGFWNKATFGLVGGKSEDKAAKKEAKRQAEQEKKAQKQAAKQEKKAREQAAKDEKKAQEQARKEQKQMAKAEKSDDSSGQAEKSERGFWNKATLGLVGGDSEDKADKKEAKRQAEQEKKAQKQTAKDEKKAQEQAAKDEKKAQKQAEKEQKQMAKAESESSEEAEQSEQPKRGLMSKLTLGLVGGGNKEHEEANAQTVEEEMPASTPEPPVPMPSGEDESDVQSASAMTPDARKLAKLPFETSISYDSMSASGKQQAVASRATYSKHDFGITDLGDVRIAVRGMTFDGGTKGGRVIISSEDRAKAAGTAGIGNESFSFQYEKGSTNCSFGTIHFSIEQGVITIGGRTVPMGKGHKLVILDEQGAVEGVYDID